MISSRALTAYAADAKTEAKIPYKYQLIRKNGVCLTQGQMDAEHANSTNTMDFATGR